MVGFKVVDCLEAPIVCKLVETFCEKVIALLLGLLVDVIHFEDSDILLPRIFDDCECSSLWVVYFVFC